MLYLAAWIWLAASLVSADEGCYSLVDTSVFEGTQQYGTQITCSTACGESYPYIAMKDGGECYCLSALPSSLDETSSSLCSVPCNGYGSETCGGTDAYTVFTNLEYLGTTLTSTTSLESLKSSTSPSSGSRPSAASSTTDNGSLSTSTTTINSSSFRTSSASGITSSGVHATTADSSTLSSSSSSASSAPSSASSSSSTSIGPIVGGVVGGLAALAFVTAIVFFFIRRKSKNHDEEEDYFKRGAAGGGGGSMSRAKSSKIDSVFDMPMVNPFEHPADELSEKRVSSAGVGGLTDPRLNPVMMGRRRISEGSLADEADYSRKILGVSNP
ncbi:hypothetical protein METBIDRAFT_78291 [Metschnikowia bicuspidata var. bicuspidata NRRL YB-4993]|uniref:WSC domain-containing protein n=1 Tax=Metschnikowia bicuspidata var. bicuspidata NRRL YB-4993 TaxID=869754 RepID=A0A1A0HB83_9ASCO|nr:hypothetical protein METBIDRAFT_78291 [Metschnikowia bicuspidata var. bicuspidata NRRL YB-4993]OBA21271.1 hypothetical protein METBIDRAFT_78291 [Metschnikowia bicuspidata var. bicuspidata NRRL YB-4993]